MEEVMLFWNLIHIAYIYPYLNIALNIQLKYYFTAFPYLVSFNKRDLANHLMLSYGQILS